MPKDNLLHVEIRNRSKDVLKKTAKSLSSKNAVGVFDVLQQHANFISMISDFIKVVDESGKEETIKIEKGVMEVRDNVVRIFLTGIE